LNATRGNGVVVLLLAPILSASVWAGNAFGQCRSGGQSRPGMSPGLQSQNPVQSNFLQQGQQGDALLQQLDLQNALRIQELGWLASMQRQAYQQQRRLATALGRDPDLPVVLPPSPPPPDPEEAAAGLLRVANALVADAKSARRSGERDVANRLLDRAEERLQKIVKRYQSTQAADEAARILDRLDR